MDYIRKTVASDFNPKTNMFAVASLNCFATYVIWSKMIQYIPKTYALKMKILAMIDIFF